MYQLAPSFPVLSILRVPSLQVWSSKKWWWEQLQYCAVLHCTINCILYRVWERISKKWWWGAAPIARPPASSGGQGTIHTVFTPPAPAGAGCCLCPVPASKNILKYFPFCFGNGPTFCSVVKVIYEVNLFPFTIYFSFTQIFITCAFTFNQTEYKPWRFVFV